MNGSDIPNYGGTVKLADIDMDGTIELIFIYDYSLDQIAVKCFPAMDPSNCKYALLYLPLLMIDLENHDLVIANVNDDPYNEILVKYQYVNKPTITVLDHQLNEINHWWSDDVNSVSKATLCVTDINEDDKSEIIYSDGIGNIYAFDEYLSVLSGFPISVQGSPNLNSLAVGDLDGNGDQEIWALTVNDDDIYYVDLDTDYDVTTVQNAFFRYDPRNTGAFYRNITGNPSGDETWKGYVSLPISIAIPSGVTVTVEPGTRVRAAEEGIELTVKGGLDAEGAVDNLITFFPNEAEWDGIWADGITASYPVVLQHCIIRDGKYGVHANDIDEPDYLTIDDSFIKYCNTGIYLVDSNPTITDNEVTYNGYGMIVKSSLPDIKRNFFCDNNNVGLYFLNGSSAQYIERNIINNNGSHGVYCTNESDPEFHCVSGSGGYNELSDNGGDGFLAQDNSYPVLGFDIPNRWGNNTIDSQVGYRVKNANGGAAYIYAEWNYWCPEPYPAYFYGNVDYIPYLEDPPSESIGSGPKGKKGKEQFVAADPPPDPNYYNQLGTELLASGEYTEALVYFNCVLTNFSNSEGAFYALSHALLCIKYQGLVDSAIVFLDEAGLTTANSDLSDYAIYLSINLLHKTEQYEVALEFCDSLLNDSTTSEEIQKDALLEKGFVLKYGMGNLPLASQIFTSYLINYPDDELAFIAAAELDSSLSQIGGHPEKGNLVSGLIPREFGLHQNYPNPFNSVTVIRYDLPELSEVSVQIFNLLGQEVNTLRLGRETAGYKSVCWNGTNQSGALVSSGLYLLRLDAKGLNSGENFVKTMKMIVLK